MPGPSLQLRNLATAQWMPAIWRSAHQLASLLLVAVAIGVAPASVRAQGRQVVDGSALTLEGEVEVLYQDDDTGGRLLHFLKTTNGRVPLRLPGNGPEVRSGSRVRVAGNLAAGTVTTTAVTTVTVAKSRTLGPLNALVILFNFTDNPSEPYTAAAVGAINDQVRNFYLETSYGQTIVSFTVAGWLTISASSATCDYSNWAGLAETAASNAGFNLAAYDRRILAFPKTAACQWWGMGNVAGPRSWINGTYGLRVVAHEQGHNFGNHHSHAVPCDQDVCTSVEYGDDRDVLGASGIVGHMNAYQKERLGWLNYGISPAIRTVSTSDDYWIDNYETIAGGTKALKIWNEANSTYYYIESRAQIGFDEGIAPGVTIHSGSPTSGATSNQIDLSPATSAWSSTLNVGQIFADSALNLTIQTLSSNVDGAMLRISFGTR